MYAAERSRTRFALFLAGHGQENKGAGRLCFPRGKRFRNFNHGRNTRSIVHRAVINAVAISTGLPSPK